MVTICGDCCKAELLLPGFHNGLLFLWLFFCQNICYVLFPPQGYQMVRKNCCSVMPDTGHANKGFISKAHHSVVSTVRKQLPLKKATGSPVKQNLLLLHFLKSQSDCFTEQMFNHYGVLSWQYR